MGHLEKQVLERVRNTRMQRAILAIVESLSGLTTQALAGSIYKMYKLMDQAEQRRKYRTILAARTRLTKRGLLKKSGIFLTLTAKGVRVLREWGQREYAVPRPAKWDGKWRVIIFDVPEKRRLLRNKIRNTLKIIGFKQLQQSVWIYPYDCEDFITLLKSDFKIGKDLLYLIAEGVEYDRHLRDHFKVYTS